MSRRVDMTIAPLLDTLDRRKDVDFVDYSTSAQCFFGLADNAVVSLATRVDDLNQPNVTVGYVAGSPQGAWLMKRLPNAAKIGLKLAPTDVPVNAVITRRVDVAPIDKYFFAGVARRVPGLVTVPKGKACLASSELATPVGIAVARNQRIFLTWLRAVASETRTQLRLARSTRIPN